MKALLTPRPSAARLQYSEQSIYRQRVRRPLPGSQPGGFRRFRRSVIDSLLDTRMRGAAADAVVPALLYGMERALVQDPSASAAS